METLGRSLRPFVNAVDVSGLDRSLWSSSQLRLRYNVHIHIGAATVREWIVEGPYGNTLPASLSNGSEK